MNELAKIEVLRRCDLLYQAAPGRILIVHQQTANKAIEMGVAKKLGAPPKKPKERAVKNKNNWNRRYVV